ncbi:MAG: YDG domain-containing protein, partial [Chlorobiaceae bacterium]
GSFGTKGVGTDKTVTLTSIYGGADLGNYTITNPTTTTTTADITPKTITISGLTASKEYDALLTATLTGMPTGWIVGDDVTVSATGLFESKGVGTGKTVTLTSIYGGADLANYTITNPTTTTTTADINLASSTVTATANIGSVTYTDILQSVTGLTATGLVNNESATLLTDVSASGSGTNAGNYSVLDNGSDSIYYITFTNGLLTIDQANANVAANSGTSSYNDVLRSLTIQANNANKIASTSNPELTGGIDEFAGTDNLVNATAGPVQYITTAATASMEGKSNIIALFTPVFLYGNYTFNDIDTVLTAIASIPPSGLLPRIAFNTISHLQPEAFSSSIQLQPDSPFLVLGMNISSGETFWMPYNKNERRYRMSTKILLTGGFD